MKESEVCAYTGKILRVDLTTGTISTEPTAKYAKEWIGAHGISDWILYNEVKPWVSPYEPANRLVIGCGPLVGTLAPAGCRISIVSKNAFTYGVGTANAGGHFGPELKFAGYDHIIFQGKARTPVYLWIEDERVTLRDARGLWGNTTRTTEDLIKQEMGDEDFQIMSCGPAGENLVRAACIIVNRNRAAGKCGLGAIMGSKNLKAVAVRGTGVVKVAHPDRFMLAVDNALGRIGKSKIVGTLRKYGTNGVVPGENRICSVGYKNFQGSRIPPEHMERLMPDVFFNNYLKRHMACFGCPLHCDKFYRVDSGPFAGLATEGFQLDSVSNFGGKLAIDYPPAMIKGCALCDELGLDEVNAPATLAWAFECYQRGILTQKDTDGLKLEWGDYGVVFELLRKLAYREGFGNILAEGCKRASEIIGKGSEYYCMHTKGQELYEEIRMPIGWGLGAVVATRGGGHTTGGPSWEIISMVEPAVAEFAARVVGVKTLDPKTYEDKHKLVIYVERLMAIVNSLGPCMFVSAWLDPELASLKEFAELYSAATGWETTESELIKISDRILSLEKAFNALHGNLARKDDYPPERSFKEPISSGMYEGFTLSKEKYDKMLDEYYELRGWNPNTGWPTRECLEDLDLGNVANDLEGAHKL